MTEEYDEAVSMLITDSVFVDADGNRLGSNPLNAWNTSNNNVSYPYLKTKEKDDGEGAVVKSRSSSVNGNTGEHSSLSSSTYPTTYMHPDYEQTDDPYPEPIPLSDSFLLANVDVSQDAVLITSDLRALDDEENYQNGTVGHSLYPRHPNQRSSHTTVPRHPGRNRRPDYSNPPSSSSSSSSIPSVSNRYPSGLPARGNHHVSNDTDGDDLDEFERLEKEALRVQEQLHTMHHNSSSLSVPSSVRSSISSIAPIHETTVGTKNDHHQPTYTNLVAPLQPPLSSHPPSLSASVSSDAFVPTEPPLSSIPSNTAKSVTAKVPSSTAIVPPSMPPLDGLSETERQLALIVQSKVQALQDQINRYQTERLKLEENQKQLQEEKRKLDESSRELSKDRDTFKAWRDAESARFESWKTEVTGKLEKERRVAVRQAHAAAAAARALPDRQERQELETLRTTVTKLKADVATGETRYKATIERHRTQLTRAQERIQELENQVKKYEEERITFVFGNGGDGSNSGIQINHSNDNHNHPYADTNGSMNKSVDHSSDTNSNAVRGRKNSITNTKSGGAISRRGNDASAVRNTEGSTKVSSSRGKSIEPKSSTTVTATDTKVSRATNNSETDNESESVDNNDDDYPSTRSPQHHTTSHDHSLKGNRNPANPNPRDSNASDEYLNSILGQSSSQATNKIVSNDTLNTSYDPSRYGNGGRMTVTTTHEQIYAPPAPSRSIGPHSQELPTAIHMTTNTNHHPHHPSVPSGSAFSPPKNHPSTSPSSLLSSSLATTQVLSEAFRYHLSLHVSPQQLRQGIQDLLRPDGTLQIPLIQQRELEGDKIEQKYQDGTKIVKFRNGTEKESQPNGTYIVRFSNGDIKRSVPKLSPSLANADFYYYAAADTIQSTYRSAIGPSLNYEIFEFPTGQIELHWTNNNKEILFPNGTIKLINGTTGESQSIFPDGRIAESSSG